MPASRSIAAGKNLTPRTMDSRIPPMVCIRLSAPWGFVIAQYQPRTSNLKSFLCSDIPRCRFSSGLLPCILKAFLSTEVDDSSESFSKNAVWYRKRSLRRSFDFFSLIRRMNMDSLIATGTASLTQYKKTFSHLQ